MTNIIKSISYDQEEIIRNIITLYCPDGIMCDPTYSKGVFYKNIPAPAFKFDLKPRSPDVVESDCRSLPLPANSITSIMFDPPFVVGPSKRGKPSIIRSRFGCYKTVPALWTLYQESLKEFKRVLIADGILIFKCQDVISCSKQWLSHYKIIQMGLDIGFYPVDMFILLAKHRLLSSNMYKQQHARKYHSYFIVFINRPPLVRY